MRLILDNLVYETDNLVLIEKYKAMGAVVEEEKIPEVGKVPGAEDEKGSDEVVEEVSSTEKAEGKVDTKAKGKKAKTDK